MELVPKLILIELIEGYEQNKIAQDELTQYSIWLVDRENAILQLQQIGELKEVEISRLKNVYNNQLLITQEQETMIVELKKQRKWLMIGAAVFLGIAILK